MHLPLPTAANAKHMTKKSAAFLTGVVLSLFDTVSERISSHSPAVSTWAQEKYDLVNPIPKITSAKEAVQSYMPTASICSVTKLIFDCFVRAVMVCVLLCRKIPVASSLNAIKARLPANVVSTVASSLVSALCSLVTAATAATAAAAATTATTAPTATTVASPTAAVSTPTVSTAVGSASGGSPRTPTHATSAFPSTVTTSLPTRAGPAPTREASSMHPGSPSSLSPPGISRRSRHSPASSTVSSLTRRSPGALSPSSSTSSIPQTTADGDILPVPPTADHSTVSSAGAGASFDPELEGLSGEASKFGEGISDNLISQLKTPLGTPTAIRTNTGRVIPTDLVSGDQMISVSHPAVMKLILRNQSALTNIFTHYTVDGIMSWACFKDFTKDFNIVPSLLNFAQLHEIFVLVNAGEAADGDISSFDSEEFIEALVRISIVYSRDEYDLSDSFQLALAFEALILTFNRASVEGLDISIAPSKKKTKKNRTRSGRRH